MTNINSRLDQIIPKIKEDKFIQGRGLGNEINFYIFDYDPEDELIVRKYIKHIKREFSMVDSNRRIIEFDLYKMMIDFAKDMGIFDQLFEKEEKEGKKGLFEAMEYFTEPSIFIEKISEDIGDNNVIFITGVGKVFPFVRSHNILNNLIESVDGIPLIMFFPGAYDGLSLKLFGKINDDNYYRAFRLVD